MVTIRLSRTGAKKNPYYHIVVIDSRKKDSGRPLERLGFFNPSATGQEVQFKIEQERVDHWVSQGAQLSDRVAKLIKNNAASAAA
jgi:small subunit ribosomal protein S16